ncbi:secreted protein [Melampsora americana]|nr:secreted protein [Melampsora americana]
MIKTQSLPPSPRIVENVGKSISNNVEALPVVPVPDTPKNFYPEMVRLLLSGHPGVSKTRSAETRMAYQTNNQKYAREGRSKVKDIYTQLGWSEHVDITLPKSLDMNTFQDERIVKWSLNKFPYQTPVGVEHRLLWARVSLVNKDSFKPGKGEYWPSKDYEDHKRVSALLEYINKNEFFGYVGPRNVDDDHNLNIGEYLHPDGKPYKASNGQTITQKEGWEAFKWASRHLDGYLEEFLMNRYEEIVWIRSPDWKNQYRTRAYHGYSQKSNTTQSQSGSHQKALGGSLQEHETPRT